MLCISFDVRARLLIYVNIIIVAIFSRLTLDRRNVITNLKKLVNSLDNPSSFWKILKICKPVNSDDDSISCEEWLKYFSMAV